MLRYLLIGMAKASWFYCVCIIQMLINRDKLYVNLHCFFYRGSVWLQIRDSRTNW